MSAIRTGGRFLPRVFDLSLGEGWPVLMAMIRDLKTGRAGCAGRYFCLQPEVEALARTLNEREGAYKPDYAALAALLTE